MTTSHPRIARREPQLRLVLRANAVTSSAAGLVGVFAAPWCVDELGTQSVVWTRLIGFALVAFGVGVAAASRSAGARLGTLARAISASDAAWVAGSIAVLSSVDLTDAGRIVDLVQAVGVADFALVQWWLARRVAPI